MSTLRDDSLDRSADEGMSAYKVRLVAEHIVKQVARHREALVREKQSGLANGRPLLVGMQGPQGSGQSRVRMRTLNARRTQMARAQLARDLYAQVRPP